MSNTGHVYVPSSARSEALRLIDQISDLLRQDADRDALAAEIPRLQNALHWFINTLRVVEPSVNFCDGCGEPATMRVRDEDKEEFFLCSSVECADWAAPTEQHDISAADWEPFEHPRPQPPPAKAPRLEAAEDDFEDDYEEDEEFDEEEYDEEEGQEDDDAEDWYYEDEEGDEV